MHPSLAARFPNASKSTLAANAIQPILKAETPTLVAPPKRKSRGMNKTEIAFANLLQAKVGRGELVEFRYEGMKLDWSGMTYTPDFVAVKSKEDDYLTGEDRELEKFPSVRLVFYEVKGAHIYDRDMVRFKGARAQWPLFDFQMWQCKSREWTRLL